MNTGASDPSNVTVMSNTAFWHLDF